MSKRKRRLMAKGWTVIERGEPENRDIGSMWHPREKVVFINTEALPDTKVDALMAKQEKEERGAGMVLDVCKILSAEQLAAVLLIAVCTGDTPANVTKKLLEKGIEYVKQSKP